jgi:hypothetical protein
MAGRVRADTPAGGPISPRWRQALADRVWTAGDVVSMMEGNVSHHLACHRRCAVLLRAVAIWFAILILASLNGAVRDLVVAPRIGDTIARAISTVILCGLIFVVTWYAIRWIGPQSARQAVGVGAVWVVLTLCFEFGAGRSAGRPWSVMLEDYNLLRGRIWVLVPIVTLIAPYWMGRARGMWSAR